LSQASTPQPDYDQTLKRLLTRAHDAFLTLVAPGMRWIGEVSPELPAIARQADIVWEVEDADGQRWLLHIELQTKPDADMGERLAEYAIRLWRRDHRPLRSLVVFLRQARTVPESPFVIYDHLGRESLRYNYDVLRLWEIPQERVLDTPFYELWPLAGAMQGVTADTTVAVAERIATAPMSVPERDELTRALVILAGMRVPRVALREAVRRVTMIGNLWQESGLKDALLDLARERTIQGVLESRFGPLNEDIVAALQQAEPDTLEVLNARVGVDTLEQIRARLGLSQDKQDADGHGVLWEGSSLKEALAVRERERGMGDAFQMVLEDRFGPLSEDIVTALASSDEDTLRAVGRHIMSDTLEQVRAHLGLSNNS